jgi:hypothetical protein
MERLSLPGEGIRSRTEDPAFSGGADPQGDLFSRHQAAKKFMTFARVLVLDSSSPQDLLDRIFFGSHQDRPWRLPTLVSGIKSNFDFQAGIKHFLSSRSIIQDLLLGVKNTREAMTSPNPDAEKESCQTKKA